MSASFVIVSNAVHMTGVGQLTIWHYEIWHHTNTITQKCNKMKQIRLSTGLSCC